MPYNLLDKQEFEQQIKELSKENKIQTTAMIDTGSTKNVIK